jgi:hypothetical protein
VRSEKVRKFKNKIFEDFSSKMFADFLSKAMRYLLYDARLLEQILRVARRVNLPARIEEDLNVLAEPRRVVVAHRLGVAERLEDRIRLQNALLDLGGRTGGFGQVLEALLGRLGLAGARLARDDDGLERRGQNNQGGRRGGE